MSTKCSVMHCQFDTAALLCSDAIGFSRFLPLPVAEDLEGQTEMVGKINFPRPIIEKLDPTIINDPWRAKPSGNSFEYLPDLKRSP